jgi:hypothetical protein
MSAVPLITTQAYIDAVPPNVAEQLKSRFKPQVDAVVQRFRAQPPEEGTPEELHLLVELMRVFQDFLQQVGPGAMEEATARAQQQGLEGLIRRQLADAPVERRLALRLIERSCEVMTEIVLSIAPLVPDPTRIQLNDSLSLDLVSSPMLVLWRFQKDVIVALESLDAPLDELTRLARRCSERSFEAQHWAARGREELLDAQMRAKSKNAWADWDDDDIRHELAPWPK